MVAKPRQVWLWTGVGAVALVLVVGFALGLFVEAMILLATVAVCALSLIPLVVDRRIRRRPDGRTGPDRTASGARVGGPDGVR